MSKVISTEPHVIIVDGIAIKPAFPIELDLDALAKKYESIAEKVKKGTLKKVSDKQAEKEVEKLEKAIKEKIKGKTE